jgi:hypothetical protein
LIWELHGVPAHVRGAFADGARDGAVVPGPPGSHETPDVA